MDSDKKMVVIDRDLIFQMRVEGRGWEANRLLDAYYKELKQLKRQTYREIKNKDRKILVHLKTCPVCKKREIIEGFKFCTRCLLRNRHYSVTRIGYVKNKQISTHYLGWFNDHGYQYGIKCYEDGETNILFYD